MPLNLNDTGTGRPEGQGPPAPPGGGGKTKPLIRWLLLILLASSAVFLLFQFGILPPGGSPSGGETPAVTTGAPRPDTAVHVLVPDETPNPDAPPATASPGEMEGKYTIVISAFRSAIDAGQMVDRWTGAGYDARVQEAQGWYRVTLGRYKTVSAAREEAERLKEAFEEGYWVARTDP